MAKIVEETIVIKISKIVKVDSKPEEPGTTTELLETLESVTQELLGDKWVVEAMSE